MVEHELSRRNVFRGLGAAAVLATGAGCSKGSGAVNTTANNKKVQPPTYVRYDAVRPDLPGTAKGVPDGFLSFPRPRKGASGTPGKGGTVSAISETGGVPPPLGQNKFWQELNRRLGVNLTLNLVNEGEYPTKIVTVLAGGDLPDFVQLHPDTPQLPELLRAKFADLTEFLSGDAIKEYPYLANIPPYAWPNAVYNGGIYGVPYALAPVEEIMFTRRDILTTRGVDSTVSSGADFIKLCNALSEPRKNRWACASPVGVLIYIREMLGSPADWTQHNGKFTNSYETDEYRHALSVVNQLWKSQIFHPDSFTLQGDRLIQLFAAGTVLLDYRQNTWWSNYYTQYAPTIPGFDLGTLPPADYDGNGLGKKNIGSGAYTMTSLKKASKSRIKELLRIMNWIAAPFGTEEYNFCKYGIEGTDYTLKGGEPLPTAAGAREVALPLSYIAARPPILYFPDRAKVTRADYEYQSKVVPTGIVDASNGLTSETYFSKGNQLATTMGNTVNEVIQGRKSLSDWDQTVQQWRTGGGDQIRSEYEKAYAAVHGH